MAADDLLRGKAAVPGHEVQIRAFLAAVEHRDLPHGGRGDLRRSGVVQDLPQAALAYIRYIEEKVGCPIKYVSVGAERDAYITMF
jgi:adenylosuccinate synthase